MVALLPVVKAVPGGVRVLTGEQGTRLRAKDDTVLVKTCQNTNANQEFALAA